MPHQHWPITLEFICVLLLSVFLLRMKELLTFSSPLNKTNRHAVRAIYVIFRYSYVMCFIECNRLHFFHLFVDEIICSDQMLLFMTLKNRKMSGK